MRKRGFTVVSTWTTQRDSPDYMPEELQAFARKDWEELCSADTLIYYAQRGSPISEGKATELGAALMSDKRIVLVGDRTHNIFLHLPQVERVGNLAEAAYLLEAPDQDLWGGEV
jgi:16S rRNA G1207 methylase RsmC